MDTYASKSGILTEDLYVYKVLLQGEDEILLPYFMHHFPAYDVGVTYHMPSFSEPSRVSMQGVKNPKYQTAIGYYSFEKLEDAWKMQRTHRYNHSHLLKNSHKAVVAKCKIQGGSKIVFGTYEMFVHTDRLHGNTESLAAVVSNYLCVESLVSPFDAQ